MPESLYRGRFAPSPTGPLHFGSLVTAMASFLDARCCQGEWLIRIDDLDRTRCIPGMDSHILSTMESFGLAWDGEVQYQSRHTAIYQQALRQLRAADATYPCTCSRRQIRESARIGIEGPVYPDTCRNAGHEETADMAIRVMTPDECIHFNDLTYGRCAQSVHRDVGDFVVRRADGYFAYQLAVVMDDQQQGVTHVVRGADLLESTARQIHLQQLLGLRLLEYRHIPLVRDAQGRKLSKGDAARPVDPQNPVDALLSAWRFLKQPPPPEPNLSVNEFWDWAVKHWNPALIHPLHASE